MDDFLTHHDEKVRANLFHIDEHENNVISSRALLDHAVLVEQGIGPNSRSGEERHSPIGSKGNQSDQLVEGKNPGVFGNAPKLLLFARSR